MKDQATGPGAERRPRWRDLDGIVLLDKPMGLGSTPALQRVRRLLRAAKAGHAGTLDPMATGMLPLCFGQATKACGQLLGASKAYRARLVLGAATDTGDADGQVVDTAGVPGVDHARYLQVNPIEEDHFLARCNTLARYSRDCRSTDHPVTAVNMSNRFPIRANDVQEVARTPAFLAK